jgi:hypothetical protein
MRLVLKLTDQNLPGLTRELALGSWRAVDAVLSDRPGTALYRALYRAMRDVLRARVEAFRYCGCGTTCQLAGAPDPVLTGIYLMPNEPPEKLTEDLARAVLRAAVHVLPGRRLLGIAPLLRRHIDKTLRGRLCLGWRCDATELCVANEAFDPWDLREPRTRVHARHA